MLIFSITFCMITAGNWKINSELTSHITRMGDKNDAVVTPLKKAKSKVRAVQILFTVAIGGLIYVIYKMSIWYSGK